MHAKSHGANAVRQRGGHLLLRPHPCIRGQATWLSSLYESFTMPVALVASSRACSLLCQHSTPPDKLLLFLQRTNRVFNYTLDPCGIAHIMVREVGRHSCLRTAC